SCVYHVHCFCCSSCGLPLQKGDQFVVDEDRQLYCRLDYEKKMANQFSFLQNNNNTNTNNNNNNNNLMDIDQSKGPKRPRTILTTSQRKKFKSSFEVNPKPCRKVREALAAETGLSVRVVQVWFQNQRAKV
ncbi:hypothetical protein HELRODRAFT_145961, partial [Helobdella robusta]|uniref:Homeobox domain-containing protein n=1 Tax=Helobdella robusta TaxID=6412 RepID=T1EJP4_HELRO